MVSIPRSASTAFLGSLHKFDLTYCPSAFICWWQVGLLVTKFDWNLCYWPKQRSPFHDELSSQSFCIGVRGLHALSSIHGKATFCSYFAGDVLREADRTLDLDSMVEVWYGFDVR